MFPGRDDRRQKARVFIGGLMLESNSFSPIPTGMESFARTCLKRGTASRDKDVELLSEPLRVWRSLIEARGDEVIEGLFAVAEPGGPVTTPVYEALRDELLGNISAATPLDLVLLFLHGSMASADCEDCEADILERVRDIVGHEVVIGVELDLHASLSHRMVEAADIIVTCKEYPHTDFGSTAARLLELCDRTRSGAKPVAALVDCRMVGLWRTTEGPVQGLVERMCELEQRPEVLSVSFAHGFPWADVTDSGARMLVTTDGDHALALQLAEELRQRLWDIRDSGRTSYFNVADALDAVMADTGRGPVVLADVSDNTGGGAPGDSTCILEEILRRGLINAAVCSLWDPVVVQICFAAGEGARLRLRLGGKTGPASGWPLDVDAEVCRVIPGAGQTFQGSWVGIGDAVWLRISGVDVIVCSFRQQTFDPSILTQFGIDPACLNLIVVKSTQHFYGGFARIARKILYVAAPGANYPDFAQIAYKNKHDPYWPATENPFSDHLDLLPLRQSP